MTNEAEPKPVIFPDGQQVWFDEERRIHRGGDLPAVVHPDGSKYFYKHGAIHRGGDLPAIELASGRQEWLQDNLHKRANGPTQIWADGTQVYDGHPITKVIWPNGNVVEYDVREIKAKSDSYWLLVGSSRTA